MWDSNLVLSVSFQCQFTILLIESMFIISVVRSRSLLSTDSGTIWHFQVSNWIRWIFMTEYTSDLLQSLHHSPGFNSTFTFNDYNHARC